MALFLSLPYKYYVKYLFYSVWVDSYGVDVDLIDDSSNLPITNVSSLFQDNFVSGSSSPRVVNDYALVSCLSNPHVVDAPNK